MNSFFCSDSELSADIKLEKVCSNLFGPDCDEKNVDQNVEQSCNGYAYDSSEEMTSYVILAQKRGHRTLPESGHDFSPHHANISRFVSTPKETMTGHDSTSGTIQSAPKWEPSSSYSHLFRRKFSFGKNEVKNCTQIQANNEVRMNINCFWVSYYTWWKMQVKYLDRSLLYFEVRTVFIIYFEDRFFLQKQRKSGVSG